MKPRPYQQQAIDAALDHWAGGGGDAVIELATGLGKSLVAAKLSEAICEADGRVGVVTHVRELVRQNCQALLRSYPTADVGIYSAGLGRRDGRRQVTFGSIQTIYQKADVVGPWDLLIIDEAHLIPTRGEGMYRRFIDDMRDKNPGMRVGGLTATPYRLGEGRLDGSGGMFQKTVYTYGIADGIADGWLSPLRSKRGALEVDTSSVGKSGGEFKQGQVEAAARGITGEAVSEVVARGEDRKSWLVFCPGVEHAHEVRDEIRRHGVDAELVTGQTSPGERDRITANFKAGRLRCIVNVSVLTTGFDAPNVDLIVMLRPTLSTSLYVQMIGRGTRKCDGKDDCLVLDFAGNTRRHGPVDAVSTKAPRDREEKDSGLVAESSELAKECPSCKDLIAIACATCPHCGYEYPPSDNPSHDAEADGETPILSDEPVEPEVKPVVRWYAGHATKIDRPPSMRVEIFAGLHPYVEWVLFEHGGMATQRAQAWWIKHGGKTPFPKDTFEAIDRFRANELTKPETVTVRPKGRYHEIIARTFKQKSEAA